MGGIQPKLKTVTVTTAGTAVPLANSSTPQGNIVSVIIQCTAGTIVVGDSTALYSTKNGIVLAAATNDKIQLTADAQNQLDLAKVYIDAATSGNTASVLYFVRV